MDFLFLIFSLLLDPDPDPPPDPPPDDVDRTKVGGGG